VDGPAVVLCSSASFDQVTCHTAELSSVPKCLAFFEPPIFLGWTEKCGITAYCSGQKVFASLSNDNWSFWRRMPTNLYVEWLFLSQTKSNFIRKGIDCDSLYLGGWIDGGVDLWRVKHSWVILIARRDNGCKHGRTKWWVWAEG